MKTISELLKTKDNIAIFTHVVPDGDAIGSLFALTYVLQSMGKQVDPYVCGAIPSRLRFMAEDFGGTFYTEAQDKTYDLCIAVDCGDTKRLGVFQEFYFKGKDTVNIDHHISNIGFAAHNLVREHACSAGEILFSLFEEMQIEWDGVLASLIYGSIASDTGCFRFSNTDVQSHLFAARLMEYGADFNRYNKKLFGTNTKTALKAQAYVIENMEYYYGGKAAVAAISNQTLQEIGVTKEDIEGLSDIPKSVEGVEVGIILKQQEAGTKVSMRTNSYVDASRFTALFGGGGHVRAAGCTMELPIDQAKDKIVKALEEFI